MSTKSLAEQLALPTRQLRDRFLYLLNTPDEKGYDEAVAAFKSWGTLVNGGCTEERFADHIAQFYTFALVTAYTRHSPEGDEASCDAARESLRVPAPLLSAMFGLLAELFGPSANYPVLEQAIQVQLGVLESIISAIDLDNLDAPPPRPQPVRSLFDDLMDQELGEAPSRVSPTDSASSVPLPTFAADPLLHLYEPFLEAYAPDRRKEAGVYYTPVEIVELTVRVSDHLLTTRCGRRYGFADPGVTVLDPACGSGTYPLAVIDRAVVRAAERGPAGAAQVAHSLASNLFGFEIQPGPYALSRLRVSGRLQNLNPKLDLAPGIVLTDTLAPLESPQDLMYFATDSKVLASEQKRAREIRSARTPIEVILGNVPYKKDKSPTFTQKQNNWVLSGTTDRGGSLFDDAVSIAKFAGAPPAAQTQLYNLYVYFLLWSIWKVFETKTGPGIVALITPSSWLDSTGFEGVREYARRMCHDIYVWDLGGDNRHAEPESNVFAIQTGVAISVLVRGDRAQAGHAHVHYQRIRGTRDEKLAALAAITASPDPLVGPWQAGQPGLRDPMVPALAEGLWTSSPPLTQLFPWAQSGSVFKRTWPIAPHQELLKRRWRRLVSSEKEERAELFKENDLKIDQTKGDLPAISTLDEDSTPPKIARYGYRFGDRQWVFNDPRVGNSLSPSLWETLSDHQFYFATTLTKPIEHGPVMAVSAYPPDYDFFNGRDGGGNLIPLYRDADAKIPNITEGLLTLLGQKLSIDTPSPEDLAAYVYAVLSSPNYQDRFKAELATKNHGAHVVVTRDAILWRRAIIIGQRLLWLHTYGERGSQPEGRFIPSVVGLGWKEVVHNIPKNPKDIDYNPITKELHVGEGVIEGVCPEVMEFRLGPMFIVKKWLNYRTGIGAGRAAQSSSALDQIRPSEWCDSWNDELLDLLRMLTHTVAQQAVQAELVDRICAGPTFTAKDFPEAPVWDRKAP